ncbi:MAG: protein kinase, partial [Acidobacteria bacterium]|nr:protein kinase [Acidobacteriota bacterium]
MRDSIAAQTLSGEGSAFSGSTRFLALRAAPAAASAVTAALRGLIEHIPDHPSLVPLVDAGVSDGRVFVVTPFVSGESLDRSLATHGPAASSDALPRLRQLADAIDRAWEVGLGHGALTPSHIVVATDCTRILDLGVAQALLRAGERVPLSSPYAAPEALGAAPCSPAADQYSLAAITHEWLFGEPPAECGVPAFDLPH